MLFEIQTCLFGNLPKNLLEFQSNSDSLKTYSRVISKESMSVLSAAGENSDYRNQCVPGMFIVHLHISTLYVWFLPLIHPALSDTILERDLTTF